MMNAFFFFFTLRVFCKTSHINNIKTQKILCNVFDKIPKKVKNNILISYHSSFIPPKCLTVHSAKSRGGAGIPRISNWGNSKFGSWTFSHHLPPGHWRTG